MTFYKTIVKQKTLLIFLPIIVIILLIAAVLLPKTNKIPENDFKAPTMTWNSPKKVEDYFVSNLRMTPEDLKRLEGRTKASFYVTKDSSLQGIIGNLTYYGFARNEKALQFALEHSQDKTLGNEGAIKVGSTGTIDISAFYEVSENMTAWELADTLLNKPHYIDAQGDYGYLFMP